MIIRRSPVIILSSIEGEYFILNYCGYFIINAALTTKILLVIRVNEKCGRKIIHCGSISPLSVWMPAKEHDHVSITMRSPPGYKKNRQISKNFRGYSSSRNISTTSCGNIVLLTISSTVMPSAWNLRQTVIILSPTSTICISGS